METLDINEIINLLFVLSLAASVAGFMAGLLGVGGGIIIVPALYYAFTVLDFDIATRMHLSVGTSLAIIIPTSIISTKTHMEYDAVDLKLIKSFGVFILFGVIGGTFLVVNLKTPAFVLFFSIMAFIVGLFFIFFREQLLKNPKMISDSAARVLEEIMIHIDYQENDLNLRSFLKRNLNKFVLKNDSQNQVDGFLGAGLPESINLWSKAGLMSEVRHDSAWWVNSQSLQTLLVVFCNGEEFSKDTSFLPLIAKEVYEFNKTYIIDD